LKNSCSCINYAFVGCWWESERWRTLSPATDRANRPSAHMHIIFSKVNTCTDCRVPLTLESVNRGQRRGRNYRYTYAGVCLKETCVATIFHWSSAKGIIIIIQTGSILSRSAMQFRAINHLNVRLFEDEAETVNEFFHSLLPIALHFS
jgi:hypothetical protein